MPLNCGVGEDSWESLGLQGDQPVHPKGDQSRVFTARTDAEPESPILWPPDVKRTDSLEKTWRWERLRAGGEGDDRGWDGWMASLTPWTRVWVNSGSWWWTGRPGVLQSMGSQRVRHDWATEMNWLNYKHRCCKPPDMAYKWAQQVYVTGISEDCGSPDSI